MQVVGVDWVYNTALICFSSNATIMSNNATMGLCSNSTQGSHDSMLRPRQIMMERTNITGEKANERAVLPTFSSAAFKMKLDPRSYIFAKRYHPLRENEALCKHSISDGPDP